MSSGMVSYFHIFLVLVRKDIQLLTSKLKGLFLDGLAPLITQVLTYGYLFPLMGMSSAIIIPVFLGSMHGLFLHLGFSFLMRISADINNNRFICYQLTLPLSKCWLYAAYIVANIIESLFVTVPLVSIGLWILRANLDLHYLSIPALVAIIFVNQLFFTTFFLALAFYYDFYWLIDNLWPRRLVPLFCFSAAILPWKQVYAWSPWIAKIMLISPLTYVAEGLRSSVLGSTNYISPLICITALSVWIGISIMILVRGVHKKLDPV